MKMPLLTSVIVLLAFSSCWGSEPLAIWPDFAPGETTKLIGTKEPAREGENPPVTRVVNITKPTMTVHLAEAPSQTGVLILPGGGFAKVVPDKEGTEAAEWLNRQGISAFVLSYRTKETPAKQDWVEPLQDAQRAIAYLRANADRWRLKADRIGLLAFSAGGQIGARLLCSGSEKAYLSVDKTDMTPHRPDFAMLIYPWNIYDGSINQLASGIYVPADCPPTFLVHTHDDRSTAIGAALFYIALKTHNIPAELHIYGNGGHGYGLRPVAGSQISTWPDHAAHWLKLPGIVER